jgi:CBS domain-containing protein
MPADRTLADLVSDAAQPVAHADAPIGQIADMIVETGVGRIPIVDPATRKVLGILSRHDLLKARRDHRRAETARSR